MQASGLASLLGAYNSDSDSEEDDGAPRTNWGVCSGAKNGEYMLVTLSWFRELHFLRLVLKLSSCLLYQVALHEITNNSFIHRNPVFLP